MTFISFEFLLFLSVFLIVYALLSKNNDYQKLWLLLGNYVFYSLIDLRFSLVLLFISVFSWIITNESMRKHSRLLVFIGITVNVLILFVFKYIGLFGEIAKEYSIVMPVGLSFYVFGAISYIVDSYKGKLKTNTTLIDELIYLSFFPIVMSGPIVKARDFLPQLQIQRRVTLNGFEIGLQRFVLGMFEKMVIADRLSASVDAVYTAPAAYSGASLLFNTLSYSLQLFFDFAGYSNMAIGVATILGFSVCENFNLPYIATNPSDFWKRWHISLSSWITEYVYIPLGGNRKGRLRTLINIMFAMVISGVWHGSTLNFILWGAGHGIAQVVYKCLYDKINTIKHNSFNDNPMVKAISIIITFILINLLWIPFRSTDVSMSLTVIGRIITWADGLNYFYVYTLVFGVLLVMVEGYALIKNGGNTPIKPLNLRSFRGKFVFVTMILIMMMFAYFGNSAFIYGSMF